MVGAAEGRLEDRSLAVAVATRKSIVLRARDGRTVLSTRAELDPRGCVAIAISALEGSQGFFVVYNPWPPRGAQGTVQRVTRVAPDGNAASSLDLPIGALEARPQGEKRLLRGIAALAGGPAVGGAARLLGAGALLSAGAEELGRPALLPLVVGSALAAALVFALARRHAFGRARLAGWSIAGLLLGIPGLLLYLGLVERPALVACPACSRPRVVTRDACERCGAPFPAPERDGTEVIE
ncbi:MAG: hypothetical protein HY721_14305 [Planctomycetes bacterium]|nr:hypothetical protein [Planctomycetota bacterium]